MNNDFLHYSIWYIILALSSMIIISTTAFKSKIWKQTLASYFSIVGITFFIEWPILVIFNGYSYFPMMMKAPFDDSMLGNVISQTSLAASAILIAVNDLSFIWSIIFSSIYSLIEIIFEFLGIYKHHWYSTWFTLFGLLAYFNITKKWYKKITFSPTPVTRHLALFLGVFSLYSPCVEWTMRIFGIYLFKLDILHDILRNHINNYVIYSLFVLNVVIIIYKLNLNFILKILLLSSIYFINYLLVKLGMLYVKPNWFLICSTISIFSNYLLIALLDRMFDFKNRLSEK